MTKLQVLLNLTEHSNYLDAEKVFRHIKAFINEKNGRTVFFSDLQVCVRYFKNDLQFDSELAVLNVLMNQFRESFIALFDEQNGLIEADFEADGNLVEMKIFTADKIDKRITSILQEHSRSIIIG